MTANIPKTWSREGAIVALELERLQCKQERLQRLYPYLGTLPELRGPFMAELAALNVHADRLDAFLGPNEGLPS